MSNIEVTLTPAYWAGVARALRRWKELEPLSPATMFDKTEWAVQAVGVDKLLAEIDQRLLESG